MNAPRFHKRVFLWRGMSVDLKHEQDDIIVFTRFAACSNVYEISYPFAHKSMYLIECPKGSIGLHVSAMTNSVDEVVLPDRAMFKCMGLLEHGVSPETKLYHLKYVGVAKPFERHIANDEEEKNRVTQTNETMIPEFEEEFANSDAHISQSSRHKLHGTFQTKAATSRSSLSRLMPYGFM